MTPTEFPKSRDGIPLLKLIRNEQLWSYASTIVTFVVLPILFVGAAIVSGANNQPGWICCSAPFFGAIFLYGLRLMARYTPDFTEIILREQLHRYGDVKELTARIAAVMDF